MKMKIYWTDDGTDKVQRADLNGANVEDLVTTGLVNPLGITLDLAGGKMYWTDAIANKIQRADLDGGNIEDLVGTGQNPQFIALGAVIPENPALRTIGASSLLLLAFALGTLGAFLLFRTRFGSATRSLII